MFGRKKQQANLNYQQVYWEPIYHQEAPSMGMNRISQNRQQPFSYYSGPQMPHAHPEQSNQGNWNPYLQSIPMMPQQAHNGNFANSLPPQIPAVNQYPMPNQGYPGSENQSYGGHHQHNGSIFQNPLQPQENANTMKANQHAQPLQSNMNPYPKQSFIPKQPSGVKSIMNSFKAQDGSLDVNKMVDTAGQMMSAVNQVSSMVKGIGGIFKV